MLAAAAAVLLDQDPSPLESFAALPGRMAVNREGDVVIVDNANSGTNAETTMYASRYARRIATGDDLTLVVGQAEGDGAVCEGFMPDQVARTIATVNPSRVVWVGRLPSTDDPAYQSIRARIDAVCPTLEAGRDAALDLTKCGAIVLAVKTWR
jgi:UDP-N-acetylmuramyl pentapeptide synthase